MIRSMCVGALLFGALLGLQPGSIGHGGTYRGPGDTVPPGGGGGGGGGGPTTPNPGGPSVPGPGNPSTPLPGGPQVPGSGGSSAPAQPPTGGGMTAPDLTSWQFWWGFNKDPYLQLKARIHDDSAQTGSDDWFMGFGQHEQARGSLRPSDETIREKIVPALVRALENESNNDIVTGAMIALAKIGDVRGEDGTSLFRELIQRRLGDSVQEIRETAAIALGILADRDSIPLLRAIALADAVTVQSLGVDPADVDDYRTRAFATYGLGLVGHESSAEERVLIVGYLRDLLRSRERFATPDIPVAAVISMGLVPVELAEVPPPANAEERAAWEKARVSNPDPAASRRQQVQFLLNYLGDAKVHHLYKAHAPRAIGQLLESADPNLRSAAAEELLQFIGRHTQAAVELRQSVALAMGQIGRLGEAAIDQRIRAALIETYDQEAHQQVRSFVLISLAQIAGRVGEGEGETEAGLKQIRELLQRELARGRSAAKPWAGLAIGVMERARADDGRSSHIEGLAALRTSLRLEKSPMIVGAYAIGAGIARDMEASDTVLAKLESLGVDETRGELAVALGLLGDRRAIDPIQEIVRDSKFRPGLLKEAAIALGLLGDKSIVQSLIAMLETAESLATQAAIASALGFIGDTHSVDPLIAMLEDRDERLTARARAFAAVALGIVADKELLPWNSKIGVDINYRANTVTLTGEGGTGVLDIL